MLYTSLLLLLLRNNHLEVKMDNQKILEEKTRKAFDEFKQSPQARSVFVPYVLEKMHLREDIYSSPSDLLKAIGTTGSDHFLRIDPSIKDAEALGIVMNGLWGQEGALLGLLDIAQRKYVGNVCHPDDNPEFTENKVPSSGVSWRIHYIINF